MAREKEKKKKKTYRSETFANYAKVKQWYKFTLTHKTWDISRVRCSYRPKEKNELKMKTRTIDWKAKDHEPVITITNINVVYQ